MGIAIAAATQPLAALTGSAAWPGEQAPGPVAARIRESRRDPHPFAAGWLRPEPRTGRPEVGRRASTHASARPGCLAHPGTQVPQRVRPRSPVRRRRRANSGLQAQPSKCCGQSGDGPGDGRAVACLSIRTDNLGRDIAQRVVGTRARAHEQEEPRTLGIRKMR